MKKLKLVGFGISAFFVGMSSSWAGASAVYDCIELGLRDPEIEGWNTRQINDGSEKNLITACTGATTAEGPIGCIKAFLADSYFMKTRYGGAAFGMCKGAVDATPLACYKAVLQLKWTTEQSTAGGLLADPQGVASGSCAGARTLAPVDCVDEFRQTRQSLAKKLRLPGFLGLVRLNGICAEAL